MNNEDIKSLIKTRGKFILYSVKNSVASIRINNPEMKNGLNYIGINEFADVLEHLVEDNVKVAVIRGSDEYFFTGGRVNPNVEGENEKYSTAIARYESALANNTVPLIAAVSGNCLKAGMGLLAICDFAIAKKNVEFGFPEVRMGGVPMMVMASTIATMPPKRGLEAFLTSWNFSAEDAYMMGLVNRVVDEEDFEYTIKKFVNVFLETPPVLIEMTRRAYSKMSEMKSIKERAEFAMKMLKEEVLPAMQKQKTEYNV